MKKLFAALLMLATCAASAYDHVRWTFADYTDSPLTIRRVHIQPLYTYTITGTNFNTGDRRTYTNTATGTLVVSNIVGGSYAVEFVGPYRSTWITNTFWGTNGLIDAKDYTSVGTVSGFTSAYSQAQSDARFVRNTNGSATNLTVRGGTFTGNAAGLTNLPGRFNSVVVDVTHGNDTIGNPFKTLNAAQAAMSASGSNYCLIRKGTYTAGTLYKTNCLFEMEQGVTLATTTSIAITNGPLFMRGPADVYSTVWVMTNATFEADGISLFAANFDVDPGSYFYGTNTIRLTGVYLTACSVASMTNGLLSIQSQIIYQVGTVQNSNMLVNLKCDWISRFGTGAHVLDANGGVKVYIDCTQVADLRDGIQISPNIKATQCYLKANVFTWNHNETCHHSGGVTPSTDLSNINTDIGEWQGQRCNTGFWTVDTTVPIPTMPRSRYYEIFGF